MAETVEAGRVKRGAPHEENTPFRPEPLTERGF
jgi:hypothetical protein